MGRSGLEEVLGERLRRGGRREGELTARRSDSLAERRSISRA